MATKLDQQKKKEIYDFLVNNYIPVDGMERNRELENSIILKNKVNFKLTVNLCNGIIDEWKKLHCDCNNGLRTTKNRAIEVAKTGVYRFKYSDFVDEIMVFNSLRNHPIKWDGKAIDSQLGDVIIGFYRKESKPDPFTGEDENPLEGYSFIYYCRLSVEREDDFIPGNDIFYSDDELKDAKRKIPPKPEELDYKHDFSDLPCPIIKYHAQRHQKNLENTVRYLAKFYNLNESIFSTKNWFDGRTGWRKHAMMVGLCDNTDNEKIEFIPFKDKDGYIASYVIINREKNTLLPCTAWTKDGINQRNYHHLPPIPPYMLRNLDLIKSNRDATIFITDSLEIESENTIDLAESERSENGIWTSWYGENETVKDVDWNCLQRRNVVYFITSHTGVSLKKAYETASDAYSKLQNIKLKSLYFVECDENNDYVVYNENEFSLRADYFDSAPNQDITGSPISIKKLLTQDIVERKFLLAPVILENSTTLLYAPTNVGKTWLAMIMGAAVASGGNIFSKWHSPKRRKVLYIDTEMEPQSFRDRISTIMKMKFDGKKLSPSFVKQNFFYKSKKRSSADNSSFQHEIVKFVKAQKISFIVLDNLAAFTRHNDSAKAWEDIHLWLDVLKRNGCSALIVHHTNKSGDAQRGSSATTNAVDNVIKVEKKSIEDDNKYEQIGMSINIEKGRDIYGKSRKPFKFKICPGKKPPVCNIWEDGNGHEEDDATKIDKKHVRLVTKKQKQEFKNEVIKDFEAGLAIPEIAQKHGVSKEKIYHIDKITNHPAYKKMDEEKKRVRQAKESKIITAYRQAPGNNKTSKTKNIAKEFSVSVSSINKIIEADNRKLVEKHYTTPTENYINDISKKTGLSEREVTRSVNSINYSGVLEFYKQKKDIKFIHEQTGLPHDEINEIIEKLKQEEFNKKQAQKKRRNGLPPEP